MTKLHHNQVRDIIKSKEPASTLMERHNVSYSTVYKIRNKLRWAALDIMCNQSMEPKCKGE